MSGSFEFVQWNACVHRQDLSLYSHLNEGEKTSTRSSEEDQTHDAASRRTFNDLDLDLGSQGRYCTK